MIKHLPTLYDKAKSGKTKQWTISVYDNIISTCYGYIGGKLTTNEKTIHKGKNIGKSNETTPEGQALKEALSKWTKQCDKGYVEDVRELKTRKTYLPMLAKTYADKTKPPKCICVQPKLNGVRAIAVKNDKCVKIYSRYGKDYTPVMWDLARELQQIMHEGDIFDGEIYVHGWDFQRIISAVKKESEDTYRLEFWQYDMPSVDAPYSDRLGTMTSRHWSIQNTSYRVFQLNWRYAESNHKDIKSIHDAYVQEGYEGIIIRDANAKYLWKHRGKRLLKYKEFIDEEFQIIGYRSGSGTDEGAIVFKCHIGGPRNVGPIGYFDVRPIGTIDSRRDMYNRGWTYVGQMLTVRFQNYSLDQVPIFPVGITVRDYEN